MVLSVETLIDETNSGLRHDRLATSNIEQKDPGTSNNVSVLYVQNFWPYLCEVIKSDPEKLGLSLKITIENEQVLLKAEDLKSAYVQDKNGPGDRSVNLKLGSVFSSIALMEKCISVASENWANSLIEKPDKNLPFKISTNDFVSLRMLLPRKRDLDRIPQAEAPTLVTGGTMTAIYLCWNLLYRSDFAYLERFKKEPTAPIIEQIWKDTRELIFRLGSGSLASFISLASACSSNSSSMIWDGTGDLELIEDNGRFVWCLNNNLEKRYSKILKSVLESQNGSYMGCAALFSRSAALPLPGSDPEWNNELKEQNVFSELLRWITAIARKQYFCCFNR